MTVPRIRSGARLHLIDEPAEARLVDAGGAYGSDPVPGRLWIAFDNGGMQSVFNPDEVTDGSVTQIIASRSGRFRVVVFVGGDNAGPATDYAYMPVGTVVQVDWNQSYAQML